MLKVCEYCSKTFKAARASRRFCSILCANTHNKNSSLKSVGLPQQDKLLAELVGIILGDGYIGEYYVSVTLNKIVDRAYIQYVKSLFEYLFIGIKAKIVDRPKYGCVDVRVYSKSIVDFFKSMNIRSHKPYIPNWIFQKSEYVNVCIRGLIDTEGSVGFKIYIGKKKISLYKQLTFTSKNPILLEFVTDSLIQLGLNPTKNSTKNIYLSNPKALQVYKKLIGFKNPKLEEKTRITSYNDYVSHIETL